jgi:mannose-1-phosphate guanylyltransferase
MALMIPVILCGSPGTRLWPLAYSGIPKQFLASSEGGSSQSLFQQALKIINSVANFKITLGNTLVATNKYYRFLRLNKWHELKSVDATLLLDLQ